MMGAEPAVESLRTRFRTSYAVKRLLTPGALTLMGRPCVSYEYVVTRFPGNESLLRLPFTPVNHVRPAR